MTVAVSPEIAVLPTAPLPSLDIASRPGAPPETEADAIIVRYENTRVDVAVNAPRAGFLVLSDVWHPWWRASVDGSASLIRRANVMFRAVRVPAGRHSIRFEFHPLSGALSDLSRKLALRRR